MIKKSKDNNQLQILIVIILILFSNRENIEFESNFV